VIGRDVTIPFFLKVLEKFFEFVGKWYKTILAFKEFYVNAFDFPA